MKYLNLFVFILFFAFSLIKSNFDHTKDIPEIDKDTLREYEERYRSLEDEDQKGYIDPIIRPEKYDVNKDRKISKTEIRKAIIYMIYPKDQKKMIDISKELRAYVKNNVDLYISSLKNDNINYRQFSYLMTTISARNFIDEEMVKDMQLSSQINVESSQEL